MTDRGIPSTRRAQEIAVWIVALTPLLLVAAVIITGLVLAVTGD